MTSENILRLLEARSAFAGSVVVILESALSELEALHGFAADDTERAMTAGPAAAVSIHLQQIRDQRRELDALLDAAISRAKTAQ